MVTLIATWLCLSTSWTVYNYIDEVMDKATGGDAGRTSLILLCFGIGAVSGNLLTGRLTDRIGPVRTITVAAPLLVAAATLTPLLSKSLGAGIAMAVAWGVCHWMINVPQQMRLVATAPQSAPLLLGLHQSTIYIGISTGGVAGAAGYSADGASGVGYAALAVGVVALGMLALSLRINRPAAAPRRPPRPRLRRGSRAPKGRGRRAPPRVLHGPSEILAKTFRPAAASAGQE